MASFLFVHGAFQGGWVWQKISTILQRQGHTIHAPTLTGCGYLFPANQPENNLMTFIEEQAIYFETVSSFWEPNQSVQSNYDLNSYIHNIKNYLQLEDVNDGVLVGHSYWVFR